jgi:hypothetical protein
MRRKNLRKKMRVHGAALIHETMFELSKRSMHGMFRSPSCGIRHHVHTLRCWHTILIVRLPVLVSRVRIHCRFRQFLRLRLRLHVHLRRHPPRPAASSSPCPASKLRTPFDARRLATWTDYFFFSCCCYVCFLHLCYQTSRRRLIATSFKSNRRPPTTAPIIPAITLKRTEDIRRAGGRGKPRHD